MVLSICLRILENKKEAEDISQEVFVKAFFSLKKHNPQSKFSNWLFRIAYTTSISKKRQFRFQKLKLEEINHYPGEIAEINKAFLNTEKKERKQIVRQAIDKLEHDEKLLINLFYYLDCSIEEISYITHQSKDYIKIKLYRIRRKLNKLLTPEIFEYLKD